MGKSAVSVATDFEFIVASKYKDETFPHCSLCFCHQSTLFAAGSDFTLCNHFFSCSTEKLWQACVLRYTSGVTVIGDLC